MANKNEIKGLLREVLVRLRREDGGVLEVTRAPIACPDEPHDDGLTRRELIGRLSLLLAGAAAFKLQGCGACNDFTSKPTTDAGSDAGDAGCSLECTAECNSESCSKDTCSTDQCATDSSTCTTDQCATDQCTTDCSTDSTTCSTDNPCSTDSTCSADTTCSTDTPCDTCSTESSFF